jgi:peptidyl-prolyl cis-trans isomerase B (cyclophilin B)
VAARSARDRAEREARRRNRLYTARRTVHEQQMRRRRRDDVIAPIVLLVVVALAITAQVLYFTGGPGKPAAKPAASASATASPTPTPTATVPPKALSGNRTWTGTMALNTTRLGISLDGKAAPQAVANFVSLTQQGFYKGLTCHRLTVKLLYVLQCGDPKGDGTGGPGYSFGPIENAPKDGVYPAGTIAMANTGQPNSQGSQFFIVYKDTTIPSDSAGGYTVIGKVTSGLGTLISQVTDKGVQGGGTDGKPVVTTTIDGFTLQ